ncbi:hypothetical protein OC25_20715 [Pedobacter kyungheensis]|uniref:Uncharacterized protein n=1 Tax=Pedobacter kyungheensis TaxID=1069985 RepID=A0A0C1FI61_9SPHI|nr:hypothetical protein OC25_20715 [Pedobacter kyungheensis]
MAHAFPTSKAKALFLRFTLIRPNKFFGLYCLLRRTDFERKIFSRHFLFLFDAKKKEPFGGGKPRQG